ncbi:MAG: cation transporter [Phycisphaerales bacterium]|nr:cation transporter [Phycisphaerales bacterium]
MPDPGVDPNWPHVRRVVRVAIGAGLLLVAAKFAVFLLTRSAAALSDALESIVNIVAAAVALYSLSLSNKPADRDHPYGHGKAEFMAIAVEGGLVLFAGLAIIFESVRRLLSPPTLHRLDVGVAANAVIAAASAALAFYVLRAGRRLNNDVLLADGKHLLSDVLTTSGVIVGLILVRLTGMVWIDAALALILAVVILVTGWRLLGRSVDGLMDKTDPADFALVDGILADEQNAGRIRGRHKVRVRRNGPFRWVDMHLQVAPEMTVAESHALASRIEGRIEQALGRANATAHVEPHDQTPRSGA